MCVKRAMIDDTNRNITVIDTSIIIRLLLLHVLCWNAVQMNGMCNLFITDLYRMIYDLDFKSCLAVLLWELHVNPNQLISDFGTCIPT